MPPVAWLEPLVAALDEAPAEVDVFFRDDDAGWADDRLVALLDLFADLALPLDVAAIPCALERPIAAKLVRRIERSPDLVGVHQHGFAHENHEAEGRKHEFGPSRNADRQRHDIEAGRERLRALLGDALEPVFTPPWNRCTPVTGRCLADLGFEVLSRAARAEPLGIDGLLELPVAVDWFRRGRDGERLPLAAIGALAADNVRQGRPVGVMFHHALMDEGERAEARNLLELLASHPRVRRWRLRPLARAAARLGAGQ